MLVYFFSNCGFFHHHKGDCQSLNSFKGMLLMYSLSYFDLFDKFKELESYYSISSIYKTMKEKMPSIFISLEAIFTSYYSRGKRLRFYVIK